MKSEYLSYVEEDEALYGIVQPILSGINGLNVQQIEIFIFYLKSLHTYYPASENSGSYHTQFNLRLETLRASTSQVALQNKASHLMLLAIAMGGLSVAIFLTGVVLMFGTPGWGVSLILVALVLFVLAQCRFGKPALLAAKEQDRRYFLESLRLARGCNELDWAGLFSYNGITSLGPQSDAGIERTGRRIADLTGQLRSALYNDEYMQISNNKTR